MRTVIVHYHIFKNSGTSFEQLLDDNYGDRHLIFDGPFRFSKLDQSELRKIIHNTRNVAYSSHQINLPVPTSLEFVAEPVVFIRHPLLRIRSIYEFGKKSPQSVQNGEALAKLTLPEWIAAMESTTHGMTVLSNMQTRNLACVYGAAAITQRDDDGSCLFDLSQALRNLDAVHLLGRTEFFDTDVPRFEEILEKRGVEFRYSRKKPSNSTSADLDQSLASRLSSLAAEIGEEAYVRLERYNRQDLQLLEYATRRLESG